jgi:hypothetical protein
MVLEGMQRDAVRRQAGAHLLVTLERDRVLVMVGEHRLHTQPDRQCRDFLAGNAVQRDEAAPLAGQRSQVGIQRRSGFPDELEPSVGPRQLVEDGAVEHEHAMDGARCPQDLGQRGVVHGAQVAPEPHQRRGIDCVHPLKSTRWRPQTIRST